MVLRCTALSAPALPLCSIGILDFAGPVPALPIDFHE